jgi:hypothetical protein
VTGRLAFALCALAATILPARRRMWGEAMRAELWHIADPRSALSHAAGCLAAAARERARDFDTRFAAGLWSVALVSGAFAIFHISCAARGVDVLLGRPDGFLDALIRSGRADAGLVAAYRAARPVVIACLFALGFAQLAAAWLLFHRQLRRFVITWCAALASAIAAVAIQLSVVWTLDGVPAEFVALLFQAAALPMLLLWSNGRHRRLGRTG